LRAQTRWHKRQNNNIKNGNQINSGTAASNWRQVTAKNEHAKALEARAEWLLKEGELCKAVGIGYNSSTSIN
jgi:hypothetical protein